MLEVKNMVKTFFKGTINEKTALQGIDLRLEEGDFCTVIGGNGAGKSTLLNSIAGVFPVDEGSIAINDIDVTKCLNTNVLNTLVVYSKTLWLVRQVTCKLRKI